LSLYKAEVVLFWIAACTISIVGGMLAFVSSWPPALLGGLSPIAILVCGFYQSRVLGQLSVWEQWSYPFALLILAASMFLRLGISQNISEISLLKTPDSVFWVLWLASAFCGLSAELYFRDCWGFVGTFAFYTVISMTCFYTSYAMLDVQLDQHRALSVRSANITAKGITSNGRTSHGTLYLDKHLVSDLPDHYTGSWEIYHSLKVGDSICFMDYPGALGVRWRKVVVCSTPKVPGE
jgi:hypothetical protein